MDHNYDLPDSTLEHIIGGLGGKASQHATRAATSGDPPRRGLFGFGLLGGRSSGTSAKPASGSSSPFTCTGGSCG